MKRFNIKAVLAKLGKVKAENLELYEALVSIVAELKTVEEFLTEPASDLTGKKNLSDLQNLIFPKAADDPSNPDPGEGSLFFDKSRSRFNAAVDSYDHYDFPTPESCRITDANDQVIATATNTILDFDTEIFDHFDLYDSASVTRITFPISGRYLVGVNLRWEANATGYRRVRIRKNGSAFIAVASQPAVATAGAETEQGCCTVYEFEEGDYVEVQVFQNSGGDLDVMATTEYSAIFYAHRLG